MLCSDANYDASGEFAYNVGLPEKSGVGGGIIAVVPDVMSIVVWSPRLNSYGNSYSGIIDQLFHKFIIF